MKFKAVVFMVLGWFVPGLGHALQKKYVRALLFFGSILAMTAMGLSMAARSIRSRPTTR